jgi:hypothetical protein
LASDALRHTSKGNNHACKRTLLSTVSSPDSSVGIATGYWLGEGRSIAAKANDFSILDSAQTGSGSHPAPIHWVPRALFPGIKRPRRIADHSAASSAEGYSSTPAYVFTAQCLIN